MRRALLVVGIAGRLDVRVAPARDSVGWFLVVGAGCSLLVRTEFSARSCSLVESVSRCASQPLAPLRARRPAGTGTALRRLPPRAIESRRDTRSALARAHSTQPQSRLACRLAYRASTRSARRG